MFLLTNLLGASAFVGLGIMLTWTMISPILIKFSQRYQTQLMARTDARISGVGEVTKAFANYICMVF
jgi:hypothetical protein